MQFHPMKVFPVKRSHRGVVQKATTSLPTAEFVRQICDEFTELHRQHVNIGTNRLIGGLATIGRHSAVILIHGENGRRGKNHITETPGGRTSGYRKADHLMQLACKFRQPIVVCCFAPPSSSGTVAAELLEDLCVQKHSLSQWYLDVPIVLVVLTSKSAYDIFGVWLADKVIVLQQAQFMMSIPGQGKQRRIKVGAEELLRGGVIDKTISSPSNLTRHFQVAMPYRLRNALSKILDDMSRVSPKELMMSRREKIARVEAMAVKLSRQVTSV